MICFRQQGELICSRQLAKGYDINPINSTHVETVVLFSKGDIDSKRVKVEFSLENMDMSEFQNGATYEQIKEYVLCKTGLKVSSLYISQVKRKSSLEVGKHYNMRKATRRMDCLQDDLTTAASPENDNSQGLAKSEDAKQPQCPPEKEQAIMDAFKHFGLI